MHLTPDMSRGCFIFGDCGEANSLFHSRSYRRCDIISCRGWACSCHKQAFCTFSTATSDAISSVVGEDIILPKSTVAHRPHGYRISANTPLYPRILFRFFLEKRRNQKAAIGAFPLLPLYGSSRCICPPSDVHPSARQSTTFCRFVCVTKWG